MKRLLPLILFLLSINCFGQVQYNQLWVKAYGGSLDDVPLNILEIPGNGYLLYGVSQSDDGDVSANYGDYDAWVVKVDNDGELEWEKNYGGSMRDEFQSVKQTPDGGYIMVGQTYSNDHDVTVSYGEGDIWIVKTNATGAIEWQKSIGTQDSDIGVDVALDDDGYVIAGGNDDYSLLKVSNTGDLMWTRHYGPAGIYTFYTSVIANGDGTFVLAGLSGNFYDTQYAILLKVTSAGSEVWRRIYETSLYEEPWLLKEPNGNLVVAGMALNSYCWVLRANSSGIPIWQDFFGKNLMHCGKIALAEEGYLLSGYGAIQNNAGIYNVLVSPAGDSLTAFFSNGFELSVDRGATIQMNSLSYVTYADFSLDYWTDRLQFGLIKVCEGDPLQITLSDSTYCPPALIWGNEGFESYRWTRGYYLDTVFVGDTRVLEVSEGGRYNLVALNSYGCPSYATFDVPDPLFTPQRKDLCYVTADESTGLNKLVFSEINPQSVVDSIYIYRTNEYNQHVIIGRIGIDENEFVDAGSNPAQQTYTYSVANLDTCGLIIGGSQHMTLLLQSSVGSNDEVNLVWNKYEGFDYNFAELYRSVKEGGVWGDYVKIAQLPVNTLSYTDLNTPEGSKKYQLRITPPDACSGAALLCSNTEYTDLCGSILLNAEVNNAHCGQADGVATAVVNGGTPPYTYTWAGLYHGETLPDVAAGNYHLMVVDNEGCTVSMIVTVANEPTEMWAETLPDDIRTVACDGKIAVHISGLLPPFYAMVDNIPVLMVNDTICNVCSGVHQVKVQSSGCEVETTAEVFTTGIPEGLLAGKYRLYPLPAKETLILELRAMPVNATLSIHTLAGTSVMTQSISTLRTTISTDPLKPGVYFIKICNNGECYVSKMVKI